MSKLVSFDGGGRKNQTADDVKASNAQLRASLPEFIEYLALRAQMKRAYYDDLVKQGFTEVQALELVAKDVSI